MGDGGQGDREGHHTGSFDSSGNRYVQGDRNKSKDNSKDNECGENKDCFIASVVYGGENTLEVNVLREYRDNVLMQDGMGKKFIEFYYSGAGEKTAKFIEHRARFLIPIIRRGLDLIVIDYQNSKNK